MATETGMVELLTAAAPAAQIVFAAAIFAVSFALYRLERRRDAARFRIVQAWDFTAEFRGGVRIDVVNEGLHDSAVDYIEATFQDRAQVSPIVSHALRVRRAGDADTRRTDTLIVRSGERANFECFMDIPDGQVVGPLIGVAIKPILGKRVSSSTIVPPSIADDLGRRLDHMGDDPA